MIVDKDAEALGSELGGMQVGSGGGEMGVGDGGVVREFAGERITELRGHESRIFCAEWDPTGRILATTSEDNTVRLWDVAARKELRTLRGHTDAVYGASWSPDGASLLSAGSDGNIILWDPHAGVKKSVLSPGGDVFAAMFAGDGRIISSSDDKITLWDVSTGMRMQSVQATPATDFVFGGDSRNPNATPYIFALKHSQERGMSVLAVSDGTVRIWDKDLREVVILRGHARDVCTVAVRSDSNEILSGSGDGMCGVWDTRGAPKARMVLRGHESTVHGCCYWPRGREILTVSNDRTMMAWDSNQGDQLMKIGPDHTSKLCCSTSEALGVVAVAGGENKSLFGADFRVSIWGDKGKKLTEDAGAQQVMSALPPPNSGVGGGSGGGEGQAQGGGDGEGGLGHVLLDNAPTDEDIEDFSVAECIQRAKACMEAAEGAEGEGEGGLRWRLAGEGMRSLGEVDEDSPANVQALYAQLKALQA